MKFFKLGIILALALITTKVEAQDLQTAEVPQAVMQSFEKEDFNALDIEWERSAEHYKVEFEEGQMDRDIWYNKNGQMLRMEKELTGEELPKGIKSTLESQYSDYSFDSAERIEEKKKTTYKVELETFLKDKTILFNESGKVIREGNND